MSIILAILILGIIIMIHELGHFLMAKWSGIGVLEFSLGMGPRLLSFEKGGTRYSFKLFPFGGSCAMLGEDESAQDEHAFNNKPVWSRILVVAAGPIFNFILAFLLAMILVGVSGAYGQPEIIKIRDNYPAQAAGLQTGDIIKRVNGRSIHSNRDFSTYLFTHPGSELAVTWLRDGETMKSVIMPVHSQESGQYVIGIEFDARSVPVSGPGQLIMQSVYEVQFWIRYVFDSFYMIFHGMVSVNDISGPVGIVTAIDTTVNEAAPAGLLAVILTLVNFSVLLSANLGVMNLLPIPALDGGRLVFLVLEALRGKPIDKEKEGMVHMAGMIVLLALMVLILFNDVRKLF